METDLYASHVVEVDRSTLQAYAHCPAAARLAEDHPEPIGEAANIGDGVHGAISATVRTIVHREAVLTKGDIAAELESNLGLVRPDVLLAAHEALRPSIWPLADYLVYLHHEAILHYDGGEGERSGQLAWDVDGFRVTSEIDLAHATDDAEVIDELDYKSGWKAWEPEDIRGEFQFITHATLLFQKYPHVQTVRIAVWQTRLGRRTPFVAFRRRNLPEYAALIRAAVQSYAEHSRALMAKVPAWPSAEKCRLCAQAVRCPVASQTVRDIDDDPEAFLDRFVAVSKTQADMETALERYAAKHGPIRSAGTEFVPDPKYKPRGATWKAMPRKGAG